MAKKEEKKPTLDERIASLEQQLEEIKANFHRVDGALAMLKEMKKDG